MPLTVEEYLQRGRIYGGETASFGWGGGGGDSDWDIQTDYLKYLPPTSMQVNALYLILTYPSPCLQYNAKHLFFFLYQGHVPHTRLFV